MILMSAVRTYVREERKNKDYSVAIYMPWLNFKQ